MKHVIKRRSKGKINCDVGKPKELNLYYGTVRNYENSWAVIVEIVY